MNFLSALWLWCGVVAGSIALIAGHRKKRRNRTDGRADQQAVTLLLIRIEHLDMLRNQHGEPVLDQLVAGLLSGIAEKLSADDLVEGEYPGMLVVTLRGRDASQRMEMAQELRRICALPVRIAGKAIRPEISSVASHGVLADRDRILDELRMRLSVVSAGAEDPAQAAVPGRIAHLGVADRAQKETPRDAPVADRTWFQPQLDCKTGLITGVAAVTPLDGTASAQGAPTPSRSSEPDLLATLTRSLTAMQGWDSKEVTIPTIAIDASISALRNTELADSILWELDRHAIAPERLILGLRMGPGEQAAAPGQSSLRRLTDAGCRLDIEYIDEMQSDHGYLRDMAVYRLRIGSEFTSGCDHDPARKRKIRDALSLAERLRLPVIATDARNSAEFDYLAQAGCRQMQGESIAPAMPADACADFVAARREQLDNQRISQRTMK